jgi:hypothetical protein
VFTIENFISPKHHYHFFVTDVGDVVSPARDGFDNLRRLTCGEQFIKITSHDLAKAKACLPFNNQVFLAQRSRQ